MRKWMIRSALAVLVLVIAGWLVLHHLNQEERKKALWLKLTDGSASSLAGCLKDGDPVPQCMEIEAAIDKAIGQ